MSVKKYELTDERHPYMPKLRRIRALVDIPAAGVKAGDLGGWIEHEGNLRHYSDADSAWVFGPARVYGSARVFGSAQVCGSARVYGSAQVGDSAHVLHTYVEASGTYRATLFRTADGHRLHVGCWSGTVPEFRSMIEGDEWVEADAETRQLRHPELLAFAALCEARLATWNGGDEA